MNASAAAPSAAFEVHAFSLDNLVGVIARAAYKQSHDGIRERIHSKYLEGYLQELKAKTIVVEHDYVDRDFLEDYAAYYVRCFPNYSRRCQRLHFFSTSFDEAALVSLIEGSATAPIGPESLKKAYLGFVVVKPLPKTVIGRTCLSTYPITKDRVFPAARAVSVQLFGISLTVESTLPFQEQDSVVAACATSALWSIFHATGRAFQHPIPSPYEITRAATHLLPADSRAIPNKGLTAQMMAQAIRGVGLEPLPLRVTAREWLRIELYGYLAARIPMVLGVDLIDYKDKANWLPIGRHAVAVLGLSFGGKPTALPGSSLLLRSSRINKIYVHDDQVGPFARMEVVEADLERDLQGQTLTHPSMTTSWPSNLAGEVRAVPLLALVPIYHKIRITLPAILERVAAVDDFCRTITQAVAQLRLGALEWDVRLSTVTDFKCEVRAVSHLTGRRRRDALTRPMPRFLWRATALRDDVPILDLLYDATDIDSGDATAACYAYDDIVDGVLVAVSNAPPAGVSLLAGARQALHALSECR